MPQVVPIFTRSALEGRGFDIGEYSYGVPTVRWWGEKASLKIGRFCSISDGVEIFLGGNHRSDWITTYPFSAIAHWPEAENILDTQRPGAMSLSEMTFGSRAMP